MFLNVVFFDPLLLNVAFLYHQKFLSVLSIINFINFVPLV